MLTNSHNGTDFLIIITISFFRFILSFYFVRIISNLVMATPLDKSKWTVSKFLVGEKVWRASLPAS